MRSVVLGFFSSWLVYLGVLALQAVVPGRRVTGYARDAAGVRLRYRLNGLRVFLLVVGITWILGRTGILPWGFLWVHRWEGLAGACTLGCIFTVAIVVGAPALPDKPWVAQLYLGRRANPQVGGGFLDVKMTLYLAGAVLLALNVGSFAAHHSSAHGEQFSGGVLLYAALFTFFVSEYLFFEEVHLYTYDFVAERVGFKLGWGCLAFYPYFYCIGLWSDRPGAHGSTAWLAGAAGVFFVGWSLSRGANLQKFWFKTRPETKAFGILGPEVISDGQHTLLCGGFWGISRHVNYLGEILMATGLTLALGRPADPIPWLYPLYYLVLLLPRQADDDRRCAEKYGALWETYRRRVPYRIVPWIY